MDISREEPSERFPIQWKVLLLLRQEDNLSVGEVANLAGISVYSARAALKALQKKGYAFERLGKEGYDRDRDVPRGRYFITESGLYRGPG
jgi:predicted ArsR family transcriptional regulator